MHIIVIMQNQKEHIEPMLKTIEHYSCTFVLDRCTDGSNEFVFPENTKVVINSEGNGFLAGRMRNIGLENSPKSEDVLFLDGDKVPFGDLSKLENSTFGAVLLGVENDKRQLPNGLVRFMENNPHNGFYSCGLFLKRGVIDSVLELTGSLFNPEFDGRWGEEDRFLGDCVKHLGFSVGFTDEIVLSGQMSDFNERMDDLFANFMKRLELQKQYLGTI